MKTLRTATALVALSLLGACGQAPQDPKTDTPSFGTATQALCPSNCQCDDDGNVEWCLEPTNLVEKYGEILADIIMNAFPQDPPPPQSEVSYVDVSCMIQKGYTYNGTGEYSATEQFNDGFNEPAPGATQNTDYLNWQCNTSSCFPLGTYSSGDPVLCTTAQRNACDAHASNTYGVPSGTCRRRMGVLLNGPGREVYGLQCVNVRDAGKPVCPTNYYTCDGYYTRNYPATLTQPIAMQKCMDEKIPGPYGGGQVPPSSCSCSCTTPDPSTHELSCTCTADYVLPYSGMTNQDPPTRACVMDVQCATDTDVTCSCVATSNGQDYFSCP